MTGFDAVSGHFLHSDNAMYSAIVCTNVTLVSDLETPHSIDTLDTLYMKHLAYVNMGVCK